MADRLIEYCRPHPLGGWDCRERCVNVGLAGHPITLPYVMERFQ
jgi:hypothetical protein